MMGRQDNCQGQLLYNFDLDKLVPAGHLLRHIDALLSFDSIRKHLSSVPDRLLAVLFLGVADSLDLGISRHPCIVESVDLGDPEPSREGEVALLIELLAFTQ